MRFLPNYQPTPLLDLPNLAERLGVAKVWVKNEAARPLGSFKSLGGIYAGLRALERHSGHDFAELLSSKDLHGSLPTLLCASDGNHGLAVAAGAELAGASARVYLHERVPKVRADRIAAKGADIVWIKGTYDDAVLAAAEAARRGEGILISDTSDDPNDPVVADVMTGYGVMAQEIIDQLGDERPTHLFVQAGVGGLAAALAEGLHDHLAEPRQIVVVEPEAAACVTVALQARRPVQIEGDLHTEAEMLSCGLASAPALRILLDRGATAITVSEPALVEAVACLKGCGGPATTATGATGLAGVMKSRLDPSSRVLLIVTENVA